MGILVLSDSKSHALDPKATTPGTCICRGVYNHRAGCGDAAMGLHLRAMGSPRTGDEDTLEKEQEVFELSLESRSRLETHEVKLQLLS